MERTKPTGEQLEKIGTKFEKSPRKNSKISKNVPETILEKISHRWKNQRILRKNPKTPRKSQSRRKSLKIFDKTFEVVLCK